MKKRLVLVLLLFGSALFGQTTTGLPAPSVSSVNDGTHFGLDLLYCNTTVPTSFSGLTNVQGWGGSTSSGTCTPYILNVPATGPSVLSIMEFPALASSRSQAVNVSPANLLTTTQCLAAVAPVTTPCIAYQSGSITALTSTYTGSTITLYTTNAPASAYFEFDITIIENANATGTVGGAPTLTFSAFTPPQLSSGSMNGYSFFNFPFQTQTYNIFDYGSFGISTKSGSSLAFAMATASGTGTLSWGYDIVVRRLY
jgi:hypothetical protein